MGGPPYLIVGCPFVLPFLNTLAAMTAVRPVKIYENVIIRKKPTGAGTFLLAETTQELQMVIQRKKS